MRQFKIYVPGRTTQPVIDAKEITVNSTSGQVIFYNNEDKICATAPGGTVVIEVS